MALSKEKPDPEAAAARSSRQLAARLGVLGHKDAEIAPLADETKAVGERRTRNGRTPC